MSNTQGSFVSGLTIGFLAGAAGYFLFGTEKGKKIVKDLEQEWRLAQADNPQLTQMISQQATHQVAASSLLQTIKGLIEKMAEEQDAGLKHQKSATRGKKPVVKKNEVKFKGV